jgi:tyrosyl-tRNA synthetase
MMDVAECGGEGIDHLDPWALDIIGTFVRAGLCESKAEAKRLHKAGALYQRAHEDMERWTIPPGATHMEAHPGDVLQAGKRKFVRLANHA